MSGGVYVGRSRSPLRILLYALFTLGIYSRVFLYKTLKEMDGHEGWFLALPVYRWLLILPIGGPLYVKGKLASQLPLLVRHDASAKRVHSTALKWAALLPWIPLFHLLVQRHLTPHWALHRKWDELEAMKEVLAHQQTHAQTAPAREEIQRLQNEIQEREKELREIQQTAQTLREAEAFRQRTKNELRLNKLKSARAPRTTATKNPPPLSPPSPPELPAPPLEVPPIPGRGFKRFWPMKKPPQAEPPESRPPSPVERAEEASPTQTSSRSRWLRFWSRRHSSIASTESSPPIQSESLPVPEALPETLPSESPPSPPPAPKQPSPTVSRRASKKSRKR